MRRNIYFSQQTEQLLDQAKRLVEEIYGEQYSNSAVIRVALGQWVDKLLAYRDTRPPKNKP
uniref:Uncharacterized protein n=1 Tax=viral metagenome TaxID=1070528 RepID=A0A6M3IY23_9ZZZZ